MSIQKTPAQAAIEFKNKFAEPTKQLAPDSISKTIIVQQPEGRVTRFRENLEIMKRLWTQEK